MKMTPVKSSNIESVGYDQDTDQLHVEFKSGKTFCYFDVIPGEYSALITAGSVSAHLSQFIKPRKRFGEVTPCPKDQIIARQALQIEGLRRHIAAIAKIAAAFKFEDVLEVTEVALESPEVAER